MIIIDENKLMYTPTQERKSAILLKVLTALKDLEQDGELCGYLFFGFVTKDGEVATACEFEGVVSPQLVVEGLLNLGVLKVVT